MVDEAHRVYADASDAAALARYTAMRTLLLSDASQKDQRKPQYPKELDTPEAKVYLTQVVRSSERVSKLCPEPRLRNSTSHLPTRMLLPYVTFESVCSSAKREKYNHIIFSYSDENINCRYEPIWNTPRTVLSRRAK